MLKKALLPALAVILLLAPSLTAQSIEIDRVEPGNWWIGFQEKDVQVLVYGEDIQSAKATVDYPGVTLERTTLVENPNYQFLTLRIHEDAEPGTLQIEFTRGEYSYSHDYEIKERNTDGNRNQGFDSSDVIYLLMPDRFANGNPDIDEIDGMLEGVDRSNPDARHGGDIRGIINNLDYIKDLGMTAVWFTPLFENDMPPEYGAYHGYAATDMYRVDRRYGSNEEYLELIDTAHDMGLKVIMDMIHNHVGTHHWFIKDQPTSDWVHPLEEVGTTNFRTSTVMDPYASEHDWSSTVQGWFVTDMPDLDQRNELVVNYLIQNTIWWIEYSGIDGIRMDTHPYPYKDYMAEWAKSVLKEFPDFNIVGEAWMPNTPTTAYWQTGFPSFDGYESYLPSVTDFPLYGALTAAFHEEPGWDTGISQLYFTLSQDFLFPDANLNVIFPGNHDLDRIFTVMGEDYDKYKLALTFILTTRGIPQLYYGDEILMTGGGPDGLKRKDFPGGWEEDPINAFTPEGREELAEETGFPVVEAHDFMTRVSTWRQDKDVIHNGQLTHFIPEDNIYVYFRHNDEETIMVVLNGQNETVNMDLDRYEEFLHRYDMGYEVIGEEPLQLGDTLNLAPRQSMIIELGSAGK
ncbi:MAG: glycoside hydrolase family 13 protein [Balneolaceae bacterium]|nr:glycoside hydrolase family 13 protein [Balneolaceae bacterium]MCH8548056.1 glycoside hydrolase family 13 protein [Balneolaceae bacterium]